MMRRSASRTEMVSSRLVCTLLAVALGLTTTPRHAEAWIRTIAGELPIDDAARLIARDASGNLLTVARTTGAITVEKYGASDGRRLWRVDDTSLPGSYLLSLATDPHGDVLVTGDLDGGRVVVVKRAGADGHEIWRHESLVALSPTLPLLVDGDGDALVVSVYNNDITVLKLDGASGARLWLARLPAPARHVAAAAAIGPSGDVAIAGYLDDGHDTPAIVTRVAGADGHQLWSTLLDAHARPAGVGFDASGDVLIGGDRQLAADQPTALLAAKLGGADGSVRWRDLSAIGSSTAFAVDAAGGILLAGSDGEPGDRPDVVVARWNADGSGAWRRILPPADGTSHQARNVTVADDTVAVGGGIQIGDSRSGFFVLGLAAGDGATRWTYRKDGDGDLVGAGFGGIAGLVPGGAASLLVSATVGDEGSRNDVVLARISTLDGHEQWRVDVRETRSDIFDAASSIALDPAGDLIAGGNIASASSGVRASAAKLSPTDGRVLWHTTIDGLYGDGRVQVDPAGDVLAAGSINVGPPIFSDNPPFDPYVPPPVALTVVKLSGDDGSETWRWTYDGGDRFVTGPWTAVDGSGDVLVNAWVGYGLPQQVIKLDGERGTPLWIAPVGFPDVVSDPSPMVVDPSDDVIAGVNVNGPPSAPSPRVVKLDGATGAIVWSAALQPHAGIEAMAVDRDGDVVLAGFGIISPGSRFVTKVVGATGATIWSVELGPGSVESVVFAQDGAVLIGGRDGTSPSDGRLSIVKLDGATGESRWTHLEAAETPGVASSVVVAANGDVLAAGRLDEGYVPGFAVLALNGATGATRWKHRLPPAVPALGVEARDLVLDGRGKVVAAGALLESTVQWTDFAVVSLDAATGRDDGSACRFPRSCGPVRPMLSVPRPANGVIPRR